MVMVICLMLNICFFFCSDINLYGSANGLVFEDTNLSELIISNLNLLSTQSSSKSFINYSTSSDLNYIIFSGADDLYLHSGYLINNNSSYDSAIYVDFNNLPINLSGNWLIKNNNCHIDTMSLVNINLTTTDVGTMFSNYLSDRNELKFN